VGRVGERAASWRPVLLGAAAASMVVVSFLGLLAPAIDEGGAGSVLGGVILGVAFLAAARSLLRRHDAHDARIRTDREQRAVLVVLVLFVHSLPEGFAIGSAWASGTEGLGLFVLVAIAVQNVPEGTVTAIPLSIAGAGRGKQVAAAVATSLPQPVGAVVAFVMVEEIRALLPISFAFAAGAMLSLVAVDVAPDAWRTGKRGRACAGALAGAAIMVLSAQWLEVS
jgi:ZIP family zinc transporter